MTNDFLSKLQWKSLWLVSLCQSCGYTSWWMSSPSILSFSHIQIFLMAFYWTELVKCMLRNLSTVSLFHPKLDISDTCASAACSFWPRSAHRSRSHWWWRFANSWVSLFPSCTSTIPSQPGTGSARPWCSWERCSTQKCGPAFEWQWKERKLTRRQSNLWKPIYATEY